MCITIYVDKSYGLHSRNLLAGSIGHDPFSEEGQQQYHQVSPPDTPQRRTYYAEKTQTADELKQEREHNAWLAEFAKTQEQIALQRAEDERQEEREEQRKKKERREEEKKQRKERIAAEEKERERLWQRQERIEESDISEKGFLLTYTTNHEGNKQRFLNIWPMRKSIKDMQETPFLYGMHRGLKFIPWQIKETSIEHPTDLKIKHQRAASWIGETVPKLPNHYKIRNIFPWESSSVLGAKQQVAYLALNGIHGHLNVVDATYCDQNENDCLWIKKRSEICSNPTAFYFEKAQLTEPQQSSTDHHNERKTEEKD